MILFFSAFLLASLREIRTMDSSSLRSLRSSLRLCAKSGPIPDTLTPELKQAVEEAGESPVRLTDPETHRMYVLVRAELFERLMDEEERREQAAFLKVAKKNAKARMMGSDCEPV
jgi:hypothetical protein